MIQPESKQLHEEGPFIDYIQAILLGRKLDLLVPVGAPATFFVQRNRQRLPSATRVLIFGADHRRIPESSLTVDDAAVLHENDMPAHLENILRLLPETKNVAVIVGSSPVEQYWASELKRDFQPFTDRVNITWFDELKFSEMLTQAATMPPNSVIFFLLLIEDAAGVPYTQNRALEKFREVASVPIFGLGDFELGRGVVGGPLLQTQAIGERAAQVAIRILGGEPPSRLKVAPMQYGLPSYDWRELRRWNISEALLPPGSTVHFREPTLWEQYRWQMLALVSALLLQGVVDHLVAVRAPPPPPRGTGIAPSPVGSHPFEPYRGRGRAVGLLRPRAQPATGSHPQQRGNGGGAAVEPIRPTWISSRKFLPTSAGTISARQTSSITCVAC